MSSTGQYGRFSDDGQKPTSIEDQYRVCEALAQKKGLTLNPQFCFSDHAITGRATGTAKRTGYRNLLDAIDARICDTVVADELSRLTRGVAENGRLIELVEEQGLRVVTADGIDTSIDGWKSIWMVKMMSNTMETDHNGARTRRGMQGQLERGYQIAQAPYGYRAETERAESGKVLGTKWYTYEPQAKVICTIFEWRKDGLSNAGIAAKLNASGVLPKSPARKNAAAYWRPATVAQLLSNITYRGVVQWNGSSTTLTRARRRRQELETKEYARPDLRMVSDEVWFACNPSLAPGGSGRRAGTPRGGGKNLFSGLVRCGDCEALLSVGGGKDGKSLYCPQCEQARRVGALTTWIGYSSVAAARAALEWLLGEVFAGPAQLEFHMRLEAKLNEDPSGEVAELRSKVTKLVARQDRLRLLMEDPVLDPLQFAPSMEQVLAERKAMEHRLKSLTQPRKAWTAEVLAAQQAVRPLDILRALLDGQGQVFKTRAVLRRLLKTFRLVRRPAKGSSVFFVELLPGVFVAEQTESAVIDPAPVRYEVTASTSARRPVVWHVSGVRIPDDK